MKLTIGMIVKNEEKWLEKCLTAIKPILDNVDSELIITDTGSTDRTVEIATEYTDKVYHFDWCDDFAAARNFGLEKAQGEWFMYLDADDIFRGCDDTIRFFNSGEYKKYNAATYVSRNLFNVNDPNDYSDLLAPRMVKLHPETKFENIVHEALNTFSPPFKYISDIADHYGYAFDGENKLEKKFERNSVLLLKRLETEGDTNEMLYVYLFECFSAVFDNKKAYEYLDKGEALCKKNKSIVLTAIYSHRAQLDFRNKNYEDVVRYCNEYFAIDKKIRPHALTTDAEMYGFRASALYCLERYDEAISDFCSFFDILPDVFTGKLVTYDSYLQAYELAIEKNFVTMLCDFIRCCIKTSNYTTAEKYLTTLPIKEYSYSNNEIGALVTLAVKVLEERGFRNASKYLSSLNEYGRSFFINSLCTTLYRIENKKPVFETLRELAKNDKALSEKICIYENFFGGKITEKEVVSFAKKNGINENPDMFFIMIYKGFDFTELFAIKDIDITLCVYLCCSCVRGFYNIASHYSPDCVRKPDRLPEAARFYELVIKSAIENGGGVHGLIKVYASIGRAYSENVSENEMQDNIRSAYIISECERLRAERKYKECFSKMKEAVDIYPNISPVIAAYRDTVSSEFENLSKPQRNPEMERLALMLKNKVREMIGRGDLVSAKKVLTEYSAIAPEDPEIRELFEEIENYK